MLIKNKRQVFKVFLFFCTFIAFNIFPMDHIRNWYNKLKKCQYCPIQGPFRFIEESYDENELLQNEYWWLLHKKSDQEKNQRLLKEFNKYIKRDIYSDNDVHIRDHIAGAITAGANPNLLTDDLSVDEIALEKKPLDKVSLLFAIVKDNDIYLADLILRKSEIKSLYFRPLALLYSRSVPMAQLILRHLTQEEKNLIKEIYNDYPYQLLKILRLDQSLSTSNYDPSLLEFYITTFNIDVNNFSQLNLNLLQCLALEFNDYYLVHDKKKYSPGAIAVKQENLKKILKRKISILLQHGADYKLLKHAEYSIPAFFEAINDYKKQASSSLN